MTLPVLHDVAPPPLKCRRELKVDVFQWDVCRLPLRTASVDVIVTDMVRSRETVQLHYSRSSYQCSRAGHSRLAVRMLVQWNPSIVDTLGAWRSVLYREVSSFQGLIFIKKYKNLFGTQQVPLTEMSLFQVCPLGWVPL